MGRHEEAVQAALEAAASAGHITDLDGAAGTLLLAGAHALDVGEATNKPYVAANTIAPMLAVLQQLRMTPESRDVRERDALDELLESMSTPS